ncbi:DUF1801 domain-containing protein [Kitasatospora cinereorecta]
MVGTEAAGVGDGRGCEHNERRPEPAEWSRDMSNVDSSAYAGFTAEERAAMKDHAQDLRKATRRGTAAEKAASAAQDVLDRIAEMGESDRVMAERVHAVVTASAPTLAPKLWYGMPSYALDGKVVCFFQSAEKFKSRYATLGFSDLAQLDEGAMWAAGFALTEVTPEVEARIAELVKRAVN